MKRKLQLLTGIGCLCLCFLSCSQPPYKNPALSPEERANDLVGRLTLEESRIDAKHISCHPPTGYKSL